CYRDWSSDVCSSDLQVERARLRGDDPGLAEAAERERAEAVRVADRVHRVGREDQERVGAFHLAERVDDLVLERARRCPGEEMERSEERRVGKGGRWR